MSKDNHQLRYSAHVEEIMGNPPSKIVRWGIILFGAVLIIVLTASWFIQFPYIVSSRVEVTTNNPPANLVARVTGKIDHLVVKDGQKVSAGDILAIMESTASFESINWISVVIDSVFLDDGLLSFAIYSANTFPDNPQLGEIQDQYSEFWKAFSDYHNQLLIDPFGKNIAALNVELAGIDEYIEQLIIAERLYEQRLLIEGNKYMQDSILLTGGAIAPRDLDISRQNYYLEKIKLQDKRLERYSRQSDRNEKQVQLANLKARREEEFANLYTVMTDTRLKLKSRIDWWIQTYLLVAPIDGYVTFTKFWGENQVVNEGEIVMTVVPEEDSEIFARIYLSMKGSGIVKPGQNVYIKFDGYPYLEHGMVQGIVSSISLIPYNDLYMVDVELPNGLKTFYDEELAFKQNMSGIAEIIADDMRLIERLVYPFKYMIEKNRRK
ncbi:MAG TPA: HlyD family efflux transporter periplasmic adaptor subunit [Bacteroidales bacterium]|nr:HlyD family efflux transporter periplasmic adaptor subunit [Bacteroidales bacterium]